MPRHNTLPPLHLLHQALQEPQHLLPLPQPLPHNALLHNRPLHQAPPPELLPLLLLHQALQEPRHLLPLPPPVAPPELLPLPLPLPLNLLLHNKPPHHALRQ